MRVQVAVCTTGSEDEEPGVILFAAAMTERQIVESIANDFQCLSEKFPKTLADLNACVDGFSVTLATREVVAE